MVLHEMMCDNSCLSWKAYGKGPLSIQEGEVTAFVTSLLLFLYEKGEQFEK